MTRQARIAVLLALALWWAPGMASAQANDGGEQALDAFADRELLDSRNRQAAPDAAPREGSDEPAPAPRSAFADRPIERRASTAASDEAAQGKPPVQPMQLDFGRVGMALAIVISIIIVLVWIYRRIFGGGSLQRGSGVMRVLSRMPVTPKQHVLLLQVGRRVVVVADNGVQMTPLSQIEDPDEVALLVGQVSSDQPSGAAGGFGAWFGKARNQFDEPRSLAATQDAAPDDAVEDDSQVQSARGELSGLMEKVRMLSQQFRRT